MTIQADDNLFNSVRVKLLAGKRYNLSYKSNYNDKHI